MATVREQVAHVWRRLGFGGTEADVAHGVQVGVPALIDELLDRPLTTAADWDLPTGSDWTVHEEFLAGQLRNMAHGANPVQERMAWILQGLLVVGIDDVAHFDDIREHTLYLRTNALGSYRQILDDETLMAGMLKYLTGYLNTKQSPNQNYAREVMELFSLGQYHPVTGVRNYTEEDVAEIARALTGWTFDWDDNHVYLVSENRDKGQKTFLGSPRGKAGVPQVISALVEQPAWQAFVPRRFWIELVGTEPSPATLATLGAAYGASGDLLALVTAIATHPEFVADAALFARVKSPVELVAAAARVLDLTELASFSFGWELRDFLGQHPFTPPNVAGWPSGTRWLHAGHVLTWSGFAHSMVARVYDGGGGAVDELAGVAQSSAVEKVAKQIGLAEWSKGTRKALNRYATGGSWTRERAAGLLNLALVSPEFLAN